MTVLTDVQQMEEDLRHRSEKLNVEFKAWMDISKKNKDGQTKIARHIAAIANHGGGRLYFGVDDDGNALPASEEFGLDHYRSDAIHNLLKMRLEPALQCEVRFTEYTNGVSYPVVHVPSHGTMPVGARDENSYFHVYIRGVGPESIRVSSYQQWETLLKRCMRYREIEAVQESEEDHLSKTQSMTKTITESVIAAVMKALAEGGVTSTATRTSDADWETIKRLADATRSDFAGQIRALPLGASEADQQIATIPENHVTMGYALLRADFSSVTLEKPHAILREVSEAMNELANFGWHDFIIFRDSDSAPRSRFWSIDDREFTGVEGLRPSEKAIYFGNFDYWRAYGNSVFVICKSYREDYNRLRHKTPYPFLTSTQIFIRMHSLLAHAGLMIQRVAEAEKIAIFTDHIGLTDRALGNSYDYGLQLHTRARSTEDRFPTKLIVSRDELLNDYFGVLKRASVPFLELWAGSSSFVPDEWFNNHTIDNIVSNLRKEGCTVQLLNSPSSTAQVDPR